MIKAINNKKILVSAMWLLGSVTFTSAQFVQTGKVVSLDREGRAEYGTSVDIKEDLTKFVASKKYQVSKDLMNMATDYTSPIIGKYDAEGNWVGKTYKCTPDARLGYQQY